MGLSTAVDAATAAAEATLAQRNPAAAADLTGNIRAAARAAGVAANVVLASPARTRQGTTERRQRTSMSLATKLQVITWKEQGRSWEWMGHQLNDAYGRSTLRSAYRNRATVRARLAAGTPDTVRSSKRSSFPDVDSRPYEWFLSVRTHGRKRVPLSLGVLRAKAEQIATSLGISAFCASNGFLKNWARRHNLVNVALLGSGASANVQEAAARMADIRRQLAGVDPDLIYNVDETGLLYRCLPSRSYVPSADRRQARGSKVMHSKDRVTLTLCCNANGSHKLPITMIGKAVQPLCFNGAGNRCPLPYFSRM